MSQRVGHKDRKEHKFTARAPGGKPLRPHAIEMIDRNNATAEAFVVKLENGVPTSDKLGVAKDKLNHGRFTVKVNGEMIDVSIRGKLMKGQRPGYPTAVVVGSSVMIQDGQIWAVLSPSQAERARAALGAESSNSVFNRSSERRRRGNTTVRSATRRTNATRKAKRTSNSRSWFSFF